MADSDSPQVSQLKLRTELFAEPTMASTRPTIAHITGAADSTTKHQSPTKAEHHKASLLSILFTKRKSMVFTYTFAFAFVVCTFLLVFNSSRPSLPFGFNNILHASFYASSQTPNNRLDLPRKDPFDKIASLKGDEVNNHKGSQMGLSQSPGEDERLKGNVVNQTDHQIGNNAQSSNNTGIEFSGKLEEGLKRNESSSLHASEFSKVYEKKKPVRSHSSSKGSNGKHGSKKKRVSGKESDGKKVLSRKQGKQTGSKLKLMNNGCDIFDGRWVRDDSYPLYDPGSCPLIDEPFNCFLNGRLDNGYERYRWQPKHCNIPRLDGKKMLTLLRGKRIVFVGDSLNRNMWESLLCVLRNSVDDKSKVFEVSGREEFRTEGSYSFIFQDYSCSVEFFQSRFLVQEWVVPGTSGSEKETLRLDLMESASENYVSADILIFNTGHWWTHEKTSSGKDYYQEGSHVYSELNVDEAFRKALTTWGRWVDTNVNPKKTAVFFRGYSPSHFRGGAWNSGGQCHAETKPTTNIKFTELVGEYPTNMRILDSVVKGMKTPINYLNITSMTDFRKDAHPSIYRQPNITEEERKQPMIQDCSHWCLPGVPDTWNELVYAQLLRHNQKQRKQKHQEQNQRPPF